MFDLDQQITSWRAQLLHSESVTSSEVDELESHLRDSVEQLGGAALSVEEAFWVACRRVGSPDALALEFTKINGARTWSRRAQWMLAGFLLISLLLSVMGTLGSVLAMVAVHLRLPLWLAMVSSSTGITAGVVLLVLWAWSLTSGRSLGMQHCTTKFASVARSGYRWWLIFGVLMLVVLKTLIHAGAHVVFAQVFSPADLGAAAIVVSSTNWLGNIILLTTIVGLLCYLVATDTEVVQRWRTSNVLTAAFVLTVLMLGAFGLMSIGMGQLYGENAISSFRS